RRAVAAPLEACDALITCSRLDQHSGTHRSMWRAWPLTFGLPDESDDLLFGESALLHVRHSPG
ncbi:MAG: hypothetical protein ACK5N7_07835, partial [Curvibacter sp.]